MKIRKNYILFFTLVILLSLNKKSFSAPPCQEEQVAKETQEIIENDQGTNEAESQETQENNVEINDTEGKDDNKTDIEISADDKIEVDSENGVMIVTGNAYVKEGVTSLKANILTAFTCENKDGDTKIIQVNADRNVEIVSDQGKAFANNAIYFVDEKIIELYDRVRLEKEGDIIVGDRGFFNVITGKGEISIEPNKQGGRKKVYGIIRSKKKKKE